MDETEKVAILFIALFVAVVVPATLYSGYDVSIHRNDKTYDAGKTYGYYGFRELLLYSCLVGLLLSVIIVLVVDPSRSELLPVSAVIFGI